VEYSFALPRALREAGLRRYGFHGLSYEYIAGRLPALLGARAAAGRVVIAHLGAGASMCALLGGRSVATTMSLTPLDGLPMATRCGAIDPGAVLYLMQEKGLSADAISELLYHDSGMRGVSGVSGDMQTLLASGAPAAAQAVDLFVYRIGRELGSLAAALGGLDALVFTGGIGEHALPIRQRVCQDAAWLGVSVDAAANACNGPCITHADSAVSAWVIGTDEDEMVMRHSQGLLRPEAEVSAVPSAVH
jgi:acetate kinase